MKRLLLSTALLGLLATQASAVTVQLEGLALSDFQGIEFNSPGYGSSGPVTLDWDPFGDSRALLMWNGDYSGRDGAWCSLTFDCGLEITVASGFSVTLDSFFLGGWPNTDRQIAWSVTDLLTNTVVASGNPLVSGATGLVEMIGLTSTAGFLILFGPDGFNGGINDITYEFQQVGTPDVPVPGALLLLGSGLAGIAGAGRLRRKKAA
jgi:hypothetical protein